MSTGEPFRSEPSAVIAMRQPASASLAATGSGPNPLKIGTQIAPIFAQPITAATVSIAIGMNTATRSPGPTPSPRRARATPSTMARSSA